MGDERQDEARTTEGVAAGALRPEISASIVSFARGAVAAASFAACVRLATFAGWVGYADGNSRLLLGFAFASAVGVVAAGLWNRLLARALPNLGASVVLIAGLAVLLHRPEFLHPTRTAWLDAGLVLLLPVLPLAAHLERRSTSVGLAALGAATATVVDGFLLEPRIGFSLSLGAWTLAWCFAEARAWDRDDRRLAANPVRLLALLVAAAAVGAASSIARPFLVQHLPAERPGEIVLLASALALAALGSLLASVLANGVGDRWTAAIGSVLVVGGCAAGWSALAVVSWGRPPRWVEPLQAAESSLARTALAIWSVVALPAAACGLVARGVGTRGARALAAAALGLAAGTVISERRALPALDAGGSLEASARARVRLPRLAKLEGFALNAEGARIRYPGNDSGGRSETTGWRGIPRGRDRSWSRLEACEILAPRTSAPVAQERSELLCIGSPEPEHSRALAEAGQASVLFLDPLPSLEERAERGRNPCQFAEWTTLPAAAVVVLSEPVVSSAGALVSTSTSLAKLASEGAPSDSLWVWCDPRAFRPEGLRTVLASWREALPHARVRVLLDGYAGPLLGLQRGPAGNDARDLAELEIADVAVEDLRLDGSGLTGTGGAASLDLPRIESGSRGSAPDFDHPEADTIRALAGILGLPEGHGALGLLEALARHATAQEIRRGLTPNDDRIRVVPDELEPLLTTVRRDPGYAPAVRHCEQVASFLYRKREFDILLSWMRDLVDARPDVGAFHRCLGLALLELLDVKGALAELELAVSLDPESADARAELSKMYADAGRHAEALGLLESVWQEKPTVEIAKGLGLSYLETEDWAHARQFLEYARARAPMDGEVAHALERLEASGH